MLPAQERFNFCTKIRSVFREVCLGDMFRVVFKYRSRWGLARWGVS